jgi:drug/metabolite transporter (DMT)-like permease
MTSHSKTKLGLELSLLATLALLWGSSYLFIRIAVETIPPITLIAVRVTLAAIFLGSVLLVRREPLPKDTKTWGALFIQAVFNSIGAWTILAWGQQYVDSGLASVLNSTSPIFVFWGTLLFTRHERTSLLKLLGACLGIAGVTLIVGIDALDGLGRDVLAQLAVLFGAILYGAAAIYGKRFSPLFPTVTAAGTMIWASLCLIPLSLLIDQPWTLSPSANAIMATLVLGVACTGIALLIYFRLIRTLGSMGVASQSYLRAGIGVGLGILVLGETLTPMIALGIGLSILGVIAINLPSRPR